MDVYLPPPARLIKHPEGLIEQRIDRMAGNPSLSLSRVFASHSNDACSNAGGGGGASKQPHRCWAQQVEYTWAWHRTAAARTKSTLARCYPLTHRTLPFGGQTERKASLHRTVTDGCYLRPAQADPDC